MDNDFYDDKTALGSTRMRWKNDQERTRSQKGNKNCKTTQLQATSSAHPVEDIFALLLRRDWSQPLTVCKCSEFSVRSSLKCCGSNTVFLSKTRRTTFFVIRSAGLLFSWTLVYWSSSVSFFLLNPKGPNLDVSHLFASSSLRNSQRCTPDHFALSIELISRDAISLIRYSLFFWRTSNFCYDYLYEDRSLRNFKHESNLFI